MLLFSRAAWIFAPLLLTLAVRPNVYDGMRHVLFILPALALVAGLGAAALVEWARPGWPRRTAAGLMVAACVLPLPSLVKLHPYQMTYFNAFVGGVAGASGRYETDYWLSSYKEAIEWINHRASQRTGQPLRILVAIDGYARDCAAAFLAPGIEMREFPGVRPGGEVPRGFDYYVGTTRYGADRSYSNSPIVHRIGRDGTVFTVIRGQRALVDADRSRTSGDTK